MRVHLHPTPQLAVLAPERREPRSPSLHLSTIIKSLAGTLEPARFGLTDTGDLDTVPKIWLGQAADLYLRSIRPGVGVGEIEKEGVTMTCDNLSRLDEPSRFPGDPTGDWIVEEFKLTWMSVGKGLPDIQDKKFRHWLWQLKGYCWAWETMRARLIVVFVNGNYAPPSPRVEQFDILFTFEELADNWKMLINHAKKRGLL